MTADRPDQLDVLCHLEVQRIRRMADQARRRLGLPEIDYEQEDGR